MKRENEELIEFVSEPRPNRPESFAESWVQAAIGYTALSGLASFVICVILGGVGFVVDWGLGVSAIVAIIGGFIWWLWEGNKHPYLGGC